MADLLARLQEEASKWLDRPAGWTRLPKDEDEREAALDVIRRAVFALLYELTRRRLRDDQVATGGYLMIIVGPARLRVVQRQLTTFTEPQHPILARR